MDTIALHEDLYVCVLLVLNDGVSLYLLQGMNYGLKHDDPNILSFIKQAQKVGYVLLFEYNKCIIIIIIVYNKYVLAFMMYIQEIRQL